MVMPVISQEQATAFAGYFSPRAIMDFCKKHHAEFIAFLHEEVSRGDKKSAMLLVKLDTHGGSIDNLPYQAAAVDKQVVGL